MPIFIKRVKTCQQKTWLLYTDIDLPVFPPVMITVFPTGSGDTVRAEDLPPMTNV